MAEFFNRANLLQGSVAPIAGGNVSVPMDDPNNKLLAQGLGNLSSRLDQFSSTAFKVAGSQAKAAGTLYGARNAPTQQQLAQAKPGEVVDLPGDASSLNIFNQAAYAGSLSRVEDSVEIAGRRALTEVMAEAAADPTMDPQTFTAKLDTVVQEYSNQMGTVSPTSAGKVNASLGMVANAQVVSFSREFMAKAIKQQTNEAKENVNTIIDAAPLTITGHTANGDVTLLESLTKERSRIRSILEKAPGVKEDVILRAVTRFDKKVRKAQEDVILNWARSTESFADNPTGAFRELQKLTFGKKAKVPDNIKDVWAITEVGTKTKIVDSLISQTTAMVRLDEIENKRRDETREDKVNTETTNFNKAMTKKGASWQEKSVDMQAAINTLNSIGEDTTKLQEIVDAGPRTRLESNVQDKVRLSTLKNLGVLTLEAINGALLNEDDLTNYMDDLVSQRDKNVRAALSTIKDDQLFRDIDLSGDPKQDSTKTSAIRRRYNQARDIIYKARKQFEEKLRVKVQNNETVNASDYFNAQEVADDAVKTVRTEMIDVETKELEKKIEKTYKILDDIEKQDGTVFPKTEEGLRQALQSEVSGAFFNIAGPNPRYARKDDGTYASSEGRKIALRLKDFVKLRDLQKRLDVLGGD